MLDQTLTLPEDPEELRSFTARLLAEVKAQAILIEKLRHQLAGHRAHRFGASSETAEQLQLALETSEIAAAAMRFVFGGDCGSARTIACRAWLICSCNRATAAAWRRSAVLRSAPSGSVNCVLPPKNGRSASGIEMRAQ